MRYKGDRRGRSKQDGEERRQTQEEEQEEETYHIRHCIKKKSLKYCYFYSYSKKIN